MIIDGPWFKDSAGRILLLRGVNFSGSAKVPFKPEGATWRKDNFYSHREVSFTGRPSPLEEANEHFKRLSRWGLKFLRLIVTWEAIEHAGPGRYDTQYLDYLEALVEKAALYDLSLLIDPHQDVWSRFTGGDGAPGWTLEKVGLNPSALHSAGSAYLHCENGDPLPKMIWPTNNFKYAAQTMFTLFFAGNVFAPETKIDGAPVQEYLQEHYFGSLKQVAKRLKKYKNVVGYDTMNEPAAGYVGLRNLNSLKHILPKNGPTPSPYQGMLCASGYPCSVSFYNPKYLGLVRTGNILVNPEGKSVWLPGHECPWKTHGVWNDLGSEPTLLEPDYFQKAGGMPARFTPLFLKPFWQRFAKEIRSVHKDALIFLSPLPEGGEVNLEPGEIERAVSAPHWYDNLTLVTKKYRPWVAINTEALSLVFGRKRVRETFRRELGRFQYEAQEFMGGIPTLLGEYGVPFDLKNKRSYRTGKFQSQEKALTTYHEVLDSLFYNCTLWNYTPDNTNKRGDLWNDEDLSIFSRDQQKNSRDPDSGSRALKGFCRPYPQKTAGTPSEFFFIPGKREFYYRYLPDPALKEPTEIYIPPVWFPKGITYSLTSGKGEIRNSMLYIYNDESLEEREVIIKEKI